MASNSSTKPQPALAWSAEEDQQLTELRNSHPDYTHDQMAQAYGKRYPNSIRSLNAVGVRVTVIDRQRKRPAEQSDTSERKLRRRTERGRSQSASAASPTPQVPSVHEDESDSESELPSDTTTPQQSSSKHVTSAVTSKIASPTTSVRPPAFASAPAPAPAASTHSRQQTNANATAKALELADTQELIETLKGGLLTSNNLTGQLAAAIGKKSALRKSAKE